MSYGVVIRQADGSEVEIPVEPKKTEIAQHGEDAVLVACVAWSKCKLKEHPRAAAAVMYAFPGRETLILSRGDMDEPVFSGVVTAVGYDDECVFLKAAGGEGPQPGPLSLTVEQDTSDPAGLTVLVSVDNDGEGEVSIDPGDGTPVVSHPGDGTPVSHAYATAGTYTVTATDVDQPERTAQQSVSVPFPSDTLVITVTADASDPNRLTASVVADNKGAGEVSIGFGDGSPVAANPGDGVTATAHPYTAGTYVITVTDVDQPERTAQQEITVPFPA